MAKCPVRHLLPQSLMPQGQANIFERFSTEFNDQGEVMFLKPVATARMAPMNRYFGVPVLLTVIVNHRFLKLFITIWTQWR